MPIKPLPKGSGAVHVLAVPDEGRLRLTAAPGMRRGVFARYAEAEVVVLSLSESATDRERCLNEQFQPSGSSPA